MCTTHTSDVRHRTLGPRPAPKGVCLAAVVDAGDVLSDSPWIF